MINEITRVRTEWAAPNYVGELFAADTSQTPLLSMIGGLTGFGRQTTSSEFPSLVISDNPYEEDIIVAMPKSEDGQGTNVVQKFEEFIDLSYLRKSNNKDSGFSDEDEKAYQIRNALVRMARAIEYSFINGVFNKATDEADANKTRGLIELTKNGTHFDAKDGLLSRRMLDALYFQMRDAGAHFDNMVMFLPAFQKQMIADIYARELNEPIIARENIGGVNVTQIETGYFKMGVVWDRFMPRDSILLADVAHIAPMFMPIADKGVVFETVGDVDNIRICSHVGIAHGPAFLHGAITNLNIG